MRTILGIAAALTIAGMVLAHAQPPFPPPGSFTSNQNGPYTYYNGGNWSGQTTQNGPFGFTTYTTPDGGMHACNSNRVGQFTYTNCD